MLTLLTQTTLAVLNDISCGEISPRSAQYALLTGRLPVLLAKLESTGLIRLLCGKEAGIVASYELAKSAAHISLLDVLEATDEHLNCNHETNEEMYFQYGAAARKLGIINQMTRSYLCEIKLTDL